MTRNVRKRREPEPVMSAEEQARILAAVDPSKCFLCQEKPPTHVGHGTNGSHRLCEECAGFCDREARREEQILRALCRNDRTHIFEYTLGARPYAKHPFRVEKL